MVRLARERLGVIPQVDQTEGERRGPRGVYIGDGGGPGRDHLEFHLVVHLDRDIALALEALAVVALDLDKVVGRRILMSEVLDDLVRRQLALRGFEELTIHLEVDFVSPSLTRLGTCVFVWLCTHS